MGQMQHLHLNYLSTLLHTNIRVDFPLKLKIHISEYKYFPVWCIRVITGQSCYTPRAVGVCQVWDSEAHQNNMGFGTGRNLWLEDASGALEAGSGAGPGQGMPSRSV